MRILRPIILVLILLSITSTAYGHKIKKDSWTHYCKNHIRCSHKHPWTWRSNPVIRHEKWREWCLKHYKCYVKYPARIVNLGGVVGGEIMSRPEGHNLSIFQEVSNRFGINVRTLLAISMVESDGGLTSSAYMGYMDPSTFGRWYGQVAGGASVLARCGFGCYNPSNPNYRYTVLSEANQIIPVWR